MNKPKIHTFKKPEHIRDYPCGPCFKAGHLVSTNKSYRTIRPVVDKERCVGCLVCYAACPDGAVVRASGKIDIDYDFCKGCGICAKECKKLAINMIKEE